jgi:hypothetical protein
MAVSFSAREGATQFSVPDGCLAHLVSDLFRLDYSRTEWNVDLIRHAKSTGATKIAQVASYNHTSLGLGYPPLYQCL